MANVAQCMGACQNMIIACRSTCTDARSCRKCDDLSANCANNCYEDSSPGFEALRDCVERSGCGLFPSVSTPCLISAKEDINKCCRYQTEGGTCQQIYTDLVSALQTKQNLHTHPPSPSPAPHNPFPLLFIVICIVLGVFTAVWLGQPKMKK